MKLKSINPLQREIDNLYHSKEWDSANVSMQSKLKDTIKILEPEDSSPLIVRLFGWSLPIVSFHFWNVIIESMTIDGQTAVVTLLSRWDKILYQETKTPL